jgi:hypothetical protein
MQPLFRAIVTLGSSSAFTFLELFGPRFLDVVLAPESAACERHDSYCDVDKPHE